MINKELFYALTGISRKQKQFRPAPRLIASPESMTACFLVKGFVYECYSMDGKSRIYSWFWGSGEFIIPTSPYSNLVVSEKSEVQHGKYGDMIRELKNSEQLRFYYREVREKFNQQIAERIEDIKTLTPLENYIKLLTAKPWILEHASDEQIASYLGIKVPAFRKIKEMKA